MPFVDRTEDFHNAVEATQLIIPETKRRKFSRQGETPGRDAHSGLGKEYLAEAHKILHHISTLAQMLSNIRKPYLNVDSRNTPLSRQGSRNIDFTNENGEVAWSSIRHLTNEERDQIDLQARVILTKCAERVKEMEALEKKRSEFVATKTNPLTRLLPARLRPEDDSIVASEFIAAHHASITWYLSRRLAQLSQTQKELQEERVKRQLERTRTLGSNATREAQYLSVGSGPHGTTVGSLSGNEITGSSRSRSESSSDGSGGWVGVAASNLFAATLGVTTGSSGSPLGPKGSLPSSEPSVMSDEDEDDDIELTQSQILQFENENANMLRAVQDNLESVQQAEARLMDISALQMELVSHLTRQTEMTEKLYDDAIATTSMVEKGNRELKEAKRRGKDSRFFLLVFLLGASFSLLFLHYY